MTQKKLLIINVFTLLISIGFLSGCSDDSSTETNQGVSTTSIPEAPVATIDVTTGVILISWNTTSNTDFYNVLEKNIEGTGYNIVTNGANLTKTQFSISTPRPLGDWMASSYIVQSCNQELCTDSTEELSLPQSALLDIILDFRRDIAEFETETLGQDLALSGDGNTIAASLSEGSRIAFLVKKNSGWELDSIIAARGNLKLVDQKAENRLTLNFAGDVLFAAATGFLVQGYDTGAIDVYHKRSGVWDPSRDHIASPDTNGTIFGTQMVTSDDGKALAVISVGNTRFRPTPPNKMYLFNYQENLVSPWQLEQITEPALTVTEKVGFPVNIAMSNDGNLFLASAGNASASTTMRGVVFAYRRTNRNSPWGAPIAIKGNPLNHPDATPNTGNFGFPIALGRKITSNNMGQTDIFAVSYSEKISTTQIAIFEYSNIDKNWTETAILNNPGTNRYFGISLSMALKDGSPILAIGSGSGWRVTTVQGGAYLSTFDTINGWLQPEPVDEPYPSLVGSNFGSFVSLSNDASTFLIGANQIGNAFVY